jgi:hypothetical protein
MNIHTGIWKRRLIETGIPTWGIIDELGESVIQVRKKVKLPAFRKDFWNFFSGYPCEFSQRRMSIH